MPLPLPTLMIFTFTGWFGLYLVARDRNKPVLVYTGLGLVGYALSLALNSLLLLDSQQNSSVVLLSLGRTLLSKTTLEFCCESSRSSELSARLRAYPTNPKPV